MTEQKRMKMIYQEIGFRIRTLREKKKLTRDMLADKVGISTKFLYEIEMGKKGFSVDILYRISRELSISSDYLLTGTEGSKIPGKIVDIIECFSPYQMGHLQEVLKHIQEMCTEGTGQHE